MDNPRFNLANFGDQLLVSPVHRLQIQPDSYRAQGRDAISERCYQICEVLEAILWLDLAVELEFFPADATQRLFTTVVSRDILAECDAVLESWPHAFTTDIEIFRGELASGIDFGTSTGRFGDSRALYPMFQQFLLLATKKRLALGLREANATLLFAPKDDFEKICATCGEETTDSEARQVNFCEGMVDLLTHFSSVNAEMDALIKSSKIALVDRLKLVRDVARIQVWCINPWDESTKSRLNDVIHQLGLVLSRTLASAPAWDELRWNEGKLQTHWESEALNLLETWKSRSAVGAIQPANYQTILGTKTR